MRATRPLACLTVALAAVLLVGCSGDDPSSSPAPPPAPAVAPTVPVPSGSASSPSSPPVLAESVLARPKGYTYTAIPGADGAVPPEVTVLSGYFDGYVGRTVNRDGKPVGTVQLLRTKSGVLGSAEAGEKVLEEFLRGFSRATSFTRQTVAGKDLLTAAVPGSTASVAGWRQGKDLILLFAAPSLSPTGFAAGYIAAG